MNKKEVLCTALDAKYATFRNEYEEWFNEQKTDLIEARNVFFQEVSEIVSSCLGTKTENLPKFKSDKDLPERILDNANRFNGLMIAWTLENEQEIADLA